MKKSQKLTQYNEETLNYMLDVIKDHINNGKYQAEDQEEPQQEQPLSKPSKKQGESIECTKCGKVLNTASPAAIGIHQTSKYCLDSLAKRGCFANAQAVEVSEANKTILKRYNKRRIKLV